ncbi:capsanthin/capsorubin synthase, chromoplastic-like [Iris pallida]|uniref:Capsanthin/capsorubin synthase, chromoplastic-like n=1 Tax=Iris pallida TaxID=29817 RepID=A0AAX6HNQ7_IRIPA|nr:capsanthin/capsorubin synthase, chromoplastic-like [Iris pallida]
MLSSLHIRSSQIPRASFLDLAPTSRPEPVSVDIRHHSPAANGSSYDAAVIGCGPAGLRLAGLASARGLRVCCVDPDPLSGWRNNYGAWVDEFEEVGLEECMDRVWERATVVIGGGREGEKDLDRRYGRVGRKELKTKLLEGCADHGVSFHKAKAWTLDHQEFRSKITCSDGCDIWASFVVDASGFTSPFMEYDKPRDYGYQIAHGILAEVDSHPFDLNTMLLMDWRDAHLDNEPYLRANNEKIPTFLYAMPFDSNLIFLEETSLVSRPTLSYTEIKKRMVARLRHLGIKVKRVIEDEKCLIPMGGPLPRIPQGVMGIGGTAGMVHPSTGYSVARSLRLAPSVADAMAECLGSTRMIRGKQLYQRVWSSLWTAEMKGERELYRFGMETLLKLDLVGTRRFFDAFFDLDPHYWQGFLSSRLSTKELAILCLSLFGHASNPSRLDIVTKCPAPLLRMVGNLALQAL